MSLPSFGWLVDSWTESGLSMGVNLIVGHLRQALCSLYLFSALGNWIMQAHWETLTNFISPLARSPLIRVFFCHSLNYVQLPFSNFVMRLLGSTWLWPCHDINPGSPVIFGIIGREEFHDAKEHMKEIFRSPSVWLVRRSFETICLGIWNLN